MAPPKGRIDKALIRRTRATDKIAEVQGCREVRADAGVECEFRGCSLAVDWGAVVVH